MSDPFVVGVSAKVATTLVADGIKAAFSSMRKYYVDDDYSSLPKRKTVVEFSTWLEAQFAQVLSIEEFSKEPIRQYMKSPEFVTLLECMFAFRMGGRPVVSDGPLMRQLKSGMSMYGSNGQGDASILFRVIDEAIKRILTEPEVDDTGYPLDEKSWQLASQFAVESYLNSIDQQIAVLCGTPPLDGDEIRDTLNKYRRAVVSVLGRVQPPNYDGAASVPIDSLYVVPTISKIDSKGSAGAIGLDRLLRFDRVVVLGDPGGGKTTLSRKIAHDLASNKKMGILRGHRQVVPFVVVLRDFGVYLQSSPGSVSEFISQVLKATFQVALSVEAVEWILATGQAYVIFDGLDELLETRHRSKVADVVNAFATVHPAVNMLVTSRKVGYQQAPLASDIFEPVILGEFDQSQLENYVRNWFNLERPLSAVERSQLAEAFLVESEAIGNIRQNPLMLALMCTIYRTEAYIPRNRPDLYEKCSRMLFDRWDRHRGLLEPFEFEAHVEPALMHIAYYIYEDAALQSGITERQLTRIATAYLKRWQYEDEAKALHAAEKFISFCRGRAWVFTDVGLTLDDETLYQFTHRTFLEFFTASFLAREYSSIESLCERLGPHIDEGAWDVVAQLALQVKAKGALGGADIVAEWLIRRVGSAPSHDHKVNVLSFVVRSLSFLVTSPGTTRALAHVLVDGIIDLSVANKNKLKVDEGAAVPAEVILEDLPHVAREVRELFYDAIAEQLIVNLGSQSKNKAIACASSIAWRLDYACSRDKPKKSGTDQTTLRQKKLWAATSPVLSRFAREWRWAAFALFYRGYITSAELFEAQGLAVFSDAAIPESRVHFVPPVDHALVTILSTRCTSLHLGVTFDALVSLVEECSDYIADGYPLSASRSKMGSRWIPFLSRERDSVAGDDLKHNHRPLTSTEAAKVSLVLAYWWEVNESVRRDGRDGRDGRKEGLGGDGSREVDYAVLSTVLGGYAGIFQRRVNREFLLDSTHFLSGKIDELLAKWAYGSVSLIKREGR